MTKNNRLLLFFLVFSSNLYSNQFEARAIVESNDRFILSSEIGGKVISKLKGIGESFKKNDLLIEIDCSIYNAERDKIAVKRDIAKSKMEKNKYLEKYNTVGKFDVLLSELEFKEQEFEYSIAKLNSERCKIEAPFNGKVVKKMVNKYQNVKPQEELLEIVSDYSMEIRSVVPAKWLTWLKVNQKVIFYIEELDYKIDGNVKYIDSIVDPGSQTISVRIDFENKPEIITGMSGTVVFNYLENK